MDTKHDESWKMYVSPLQTLLMVQKSWIKPLLKQFRLHRFQKQSKNSQQKDFQGKVSLIVKGFSQEYPKITKNG